MQLLYILSIPSGILGGESQWGTNHENLKIGIKLLQPKVEISPSLFKISDIRSVN